MQQQEEQAGQVWLAPKLIELGEVGSETQFGDGSNFDGSGSYAS
ncbi:hypothetical protein ABHF91_00575 [Pseudaeromonas sp. ZJS20]